jgi:hypothetical protein
MLESAAGNFARHQSLSSKSRPAYPGVCGSLLAVTDIRCTDQVALSRSAGDFARSSGASDRVFGLLTRLGPTGSGRGGTQLPSVRGELELRHVWFRYQTATQTQWALQNVTLRMEPGSVVALVRMAGAIELRHCLGGGGTEVEFGCTSTIAAASLLNVLTASDWLRVCSQIPPYATFDALR